LNALSLATTVEQNITCNTSSSFSEYTHILSSFTDSLERHTGTKDMRATIISAQSSVVTNKVDRVATIANTATQLARLHEARDEQKQARRSKKNRATD